MHHGVLIRQWATQTLIARWLYCYSFTMDDHYGRPHNGQFGTSLIRELRAAAQ